MAIVGGTLFPQARAAAAQGSHSGYTYTQRVCQEYGQQPRHYQVCDPIPGSDWRNDGGSAIVLERGYGRAARYVGVSEDLAPAGTTPSSGTYIGDGTRFIPIWGSTWYLFNPWRTSGFGRFVKLYNNGDDSDYIRGWTDGIARARNRYNLIPPIHTGQYIRWANMQWCR